MRNRFRTFWRSLDHEGKKELAKRANASLGYLHVLACDDDRRPSPDLAKRLVEHSNGELNLHHLRPDIWEQATS